MRLLITGTSGYIGSVLAPMALEAGHEVIGLDAGFFRDQVFGAAPASVPELSVDLRDVQSDHLAGVDAVLHLAALSNDPLGDIDPALTLEINHWATARLARLAKQAGVGLFVFSSSCSTYGAAGDGFLTETAEFRPVTAYGKSKVLAERALRLLADDSFSPVFLRNATAYGFSPRLRLDLVLNDFVASATRHNRIVIKSDGTPWRPLVHVEDICRAFLAVLGADRANGHCEAFNIGQTEENSRVRELAECVRKAFAGCRVELAAGGGPDTRCYRVDCSKVRRLLPEFQPQWTVAAGVRQLQAAFAERPDLCAAGDGKFWRLPTLRRLMADGSLAPNLRPANGELEKTDTTSHAVEGVL